MYAYAPLLDYVVKCHDPVDTGRYLRDIVKQDKHGMIAAFITSTLLVNPAMLCHKRNIYPSTPSKGSMKLGFQKVDVHAGRVLY